MPDVRVSSASTRSASLSILTARKVMSSMFPTGVGTRYKVPIYATKIGFFINSNKKKSGFFVIFVRLWYFCNQKSEYMSIVDNTQGERKRQGRIEIICGSMFSGKTEELIRRLKRAKFAKQRVEIFKPSIDNRYSDEEVVSHDHNSIVSTSIDSSASILLLSEGIDVVGIDEAQFLDDNLVNVCNQLANNGVRVIVAGLDMDYRGVPFGPIPALCAVADEVTKVHAICVKCGALAYISHRLVNNNKRVLIGEAREYEPLCRECYQKELAKEQASGGLSAVGKTK